MDGADTGKDGKEGAGAGTGAVVDVGLPSFVDEMCSDIVIWEGERNMQRVEVDVKRIVREVAEECKLPIETDKEEVMHIRKSRKKKNGDRKHI